MPEDTPNPITVYGHSKYLGELAVQGVLDDYIIMRISWVFGGGRSSSLIRISFSLLALGAPVERFAQRIY